MDKLTKRIYKDYKSKVNLDGMTHSVHYEMTTALLNKELRRQRELLQQVAGKTAPPHFAYLCEAKIEALIAIITELTVLTIEMFLQEEHTEEA